MEVPLSDSILLVVILVSVSPIMLSCLVPTVPKGILAGRTILVVIPTCRA